MRVLLITGSFPPMPCGVGDYTHSLAGALSQLEGLQVGVLTSAAAAAQSGYEVLPVVREWNRAATPVVAAAIRAFRPDVVHIQYPTQDYRGDLPARLPWMLYRQGLPVVQTWHESFPLYFPVRVSLTARVLGMGLPPGDVIVVRPRYTSGMRWWYRLAIARKNFHLIPSAPALPRANLSEAEREAIRARYAPAGKALLVFFGFLYQAKGIDDLLEVIDPARHHLVLAGKPDESDPYQAALLQRLRQPPFVNCVSARGFLEAVEAARLLAAADAVVLPFRQGGGSWNTSISAAVLQGTFVLSTSREVHGYDSRRNVYFARPRDIADMRDALARYLGRRLSGSSPDLTWPEIARRHLAIYQRNLASRAEAASPEAA